VERVMLDRVGAEKARATSIVRYAPGSCFPLHRHPGGEEILVLSGTFSEDGEDYPAGWYLRNPPGSGHRPASREGALIFVKLRQMPQQEQGRVRLDTRDPAAWRRMGKRDICPLFSGASESVCLQILAPHELLFDAVLSMSALQGIELLVLSGAIVMGGQCYPHGSWMRLPAGDVPEMVAGADGVRFYLKTGHLAGNDIGRSGL
jgi:anti-sigma factor ChrR (cupin superfamily)